MLNKIKFLTAGESHGKALMGILDGIPSNLTISEEYIRKQLSRRQMGFGRGGRMKIESDYAEIVSGVRYGKTLGSPIGLIIENKDWKNWKSEAKYNGGTKDERIQRGKKYLEENFRVLVNEKGRGGRYVVERKIFEDSSDF